VPDRKIRLRGVRVHNLKNLDLDLEHGKLIVLCGLSGSGKTSLALDTLYAEGQRRYIESFSPYTRQFLERLDKPDAEHIDGIPPAVAVTHRSTSQSGRATVGTATETVDYLRLLFTKIGRTYCPQCQREIRRHSPQSAAERLSRLPEGTRFLVAFRLSAKKGGSASDGFQRLREEGFVRGVAGNRKVRIADTLESAAPANGLSEGSDGDPIFGVVDRLTAGRSSAERVRDSLETAFARGEGTCHVFVEQVAAKQLDEATEPHPLDGEPWERAVFTRQLKCEACGVELPQPEPRLFSFNNALGACPVCEGYGNVMDVDMELVVPDESKSLREGAIAPWRTPAYEHELEELLDLAGDYEIPVDVPYRKLDKRQRDLIYHGMPERDFGGMRGFFAWLERRKYKMHIRVFLSRWKSQRTCPDCAGRRLRPEALATRVGDLNLAGICRLKIADASRWLSELALDAWEQQVARLLLGEIGARLGYLEAVGVGYLTLDRTLRTLSGGESQRVALTTALGSSLVNMLYVLDEPSVGLHPTDMDRLIRAIQRLRDRGNTVVVVEHEESMIRAADQVVEIGPGAGERGGSVVFQGAPERIEESETSVTGAFLAGRRGASFSSDRRPDNQGRIRLVGARGHNLQNLTVDFPLGLLCLVTGVSGAGKSTLVQKTLYPALARRLHQEAAKPLVCDEVLGEGQLDDVMLVDQSAIGRSPRSNPVTYIKAFDAIRAVFADTLEARTNNFTASHFSFNVEEGRCSHCRGDGHLQIDMQFLADVYMTCPQCGGKRFRKEILKVRYRGQSIADVLEMTVREAFTFFRGHAKVQARLKRLIDVGLDYLRLGQPATTLSGGEAQRLKLASFLTTSRRNRTLFILDEPTTGLHFADVVQLLDCFDSLLAVGHSLIVVEHNLQLMKAADYIIDLGPGAADEGGAVVATGTPEEIAAVPESATGRHLKAALAASAEAIAASG